MPVNPGNPYVTSLTQDGFGTLGDPYFAALVPEVAAIALKAVWFQKWYVHRRLRPEAFGGLVHNRLANKIAYPLHADVLNSDAMTAVFKKTGSISSAAGISRRLAAASIVWRRARHGGGGQRDHAESGVRRIRT